jgi:tRNA(Ile)-lysidine synthase
MPVTALLERRIARALVAAGYSGNQTRLVLGVSGGPDSSALLHSLHRLSETQEVGLHVAHLNHNFRQEADEDARFVAAMCRELGVPATVEKRDPIGYQRQHRISSFEQAARELRYSFLGEVARSVGASAVAVGHTADDLAETVLQHILRGSGLHGLKGMTEVSEWPWAGNSRQLFLFRPLLSSTKADTVAYCRELGKEFREDPANYLPRFTRNRIRHHLLPLLAGEYNPRVTDSLVRLARTAALDLDFLEGETDRAWPQVLSEEEGGNPGTLQLRRTSFASLHPALQRLVLRRGYILLRGDARRLQENHLVAMSEIATSHAGRQTLLLPSGIRCYSTPEYLVLTTSEGTESCPFPDWDGERTLAFPGSNVEEAMAHGVGWRMAAQIVEGEDLDPDSLSGQHTAFLSRNAVGDVGVLRTRQPGDRFQPLGMAGEKKLQDFFTDAHVPRGWRDRVPLLVCRGRIAWVVGYRIAEWAKAHPIPDGGSSTLQIRYSLDD